MRSRLLARLPGLLALALLAGLVCPPAAAMDLQNVNVYISDNPTGPWTPEAYNPGGNTVYVNKYIRLEVTLENTSGRLAKMCVIDESDPYGPTLDAFPTCISFDMYSKLADDRCTTNVVPGFYGGQYWVWPRLPEGCGSGCDLGACVPDGLGGYTSLLYPNNPGAPVRFVSAEPIDTWDYNGYMAYGEPVPGVTNQTATVNWVFRAKREYGNLDFTVYAHNYDDFGDQEQTCNPTAVLPDCPFGGGDCLCDDFYPSNTSYIGCSGNLEQEGSLLNCSGACNIVTNPINNEPDPKPPLDEILKDYWGGTIKIESPLEVHGDIKVATPGLRPPGVAFIGDVLELWVSATNTGADTVDVVGLAAPRIPASSTIYLVSKDVQVGQCASSIPHYWPSGTVTMTSGMQQTFTWSFTVLGERTCPTLPEGGTLYFDPVDLYGAVLASSTLIVAPPPLVVSVTLYLDPDGSGPLPPQPASPHKLHPDGMLYYMSDDVLEARVILTNTSGVYSYDATPAVTLGGTGGASYRLVSGPAGALFLDPSSSTTFVYRYEINPDAALGKSCVGPGPYEITVSAAARGKCGQNRTWVSNMPFKGCDNLHYDIEGLAGVSVEVFNGIDVNLHVTNPLTRTITMNSRVGCALDITAPPGDTTEWLIQSNPPSPVQSWAPGEEKAPFTWNVMPTRSGTMYMCCGLSYNTVPPCVYGCADSAPCQGSCPCAEASKLKVLPEQVLEIVSFTATPTYEFNNSARTHKVHLEMVILNSSNSDWVTIANVRNPCNADTGSGLTIETGPLPIPPFDVPPLFSFSVVWDIWVRCAEDLRFGFHTNSTCNPLVYGYLLEEPDKTQEVDAVTAPPLTLKDPATLTCALALDATEYSEGETITVYWSVTNIGSNDGLQFSVTITPDYEISNAFTPLDSPPLEVTLAAPPPPVLPGSGVCPVPTPYPADTMQVYRAVFRAEKWGTVRFVASSSVADEFYGDRPVCQKITPSTIIRKASTLSVTAWATGTVTMPQDCLECPVRSGCQPDGTNCIFVSAIVKNSGEVALEEVTPSVFTAVSPCEPGECQLCDTCTGSAVQISQPPAEDIGEVLDGFESTRSFTWSFSPSGTGCLRFRVAVSAWDSETSATRFEEVLTNCVQILPQPPVSLRLLSAPARVVIGQEFGVQVEIANPGETPVLMQGGEPSISFSLLSNDAAVTEHFEIRPPPPVTVPPGESAVITVMVRALPTAPLDKVKLSVPEGAAFIAKDTVTGLSWAVWDAGTGDPVVVEVTAASYSLEGGTPNPFRPNRDGVTQITFRLPEEGNVRLGIYSITGELVRKLVDEARPVGYYREPWDGKNDAGQNCASGIYLIRIEGPNYSPKPAKIALIR